MKKLLSLYIGSLVNISWHLIEGLPFSESLRRTHHETLKLNHQNKKQNMFFSPNPLCLKCMGWISCFLVCFSYQSIFLRRESDVVSPSIKIIIPLPKKGTNEAGGTFEKTRYCLWQRLLADQNWLNSTKMTQRSCFC